MQVKILDTYGLIWFDENQIPMRKEFVNWCIDNDLEYNGGEHGYIIVYPKNSIQMIMFKLRWQG